LKWPLVTRERYAEQVKQAEALFVANQNMLVDLEFHKTSHSKLRALCNQLESKLRDCTQPPISSEDLAMTLKRLAFLQAENDALKAKHD
jgi:hypothetical protein